MTTQTNRNRNRTPYRARARGGGQWAPEYLGLRALYDYRNATSTTMVDQSGNGRADATVGAGSNSPLWLPYTKPQVYLPGTSNRITSNSGASFDVTDLDVWSEIVSDDWTPSTAVALIERMGADPTRCFQLLLNTAGTVSLIWYPTGSAASAITRTTSTTIEAASGVAASGAVAVRATLDVDDGAGNHVVTFYYQLGGFDGTWTLWQTITTAGTTSLPSVSRVIELGGAGAGAGTVPVAIRKARLHASIGGAVRADFDAALCGQSGYTDAVGSVGAAWTVARSTSGRKSVVQSPTANSATGLFLFGTDDWIVLPAAATPPMAAANTSTILFVMRAHANAAAGFGRYFSNNSGAGNGRIELLDGSGGTANLAAQLVDTSASAGTTAARAWTAGTRAVYAVTINGTVANGLQLSLNGGAAATATGPAGDRTSANPIYVGRNGASAAAFVDMEFQAIATADRVLSSGEIAQVVAYYGGGL